MIRHLLSALRSLRDRLSGSNPRASAKKVSAQYDLLNAATINLRLDDIRFARDLITIF